MIWVRSLIPLSPQTRQQLSALDSVISFAFLQHVSKSAPRTRILFVALPLSTAKETDIIPGISNSILVSVVGCNLQQVGSVVVVATVVVVVGAGVVTSTGLPTNR